MIVWAAALFGKEDMKAAEKEALVHVEKMKLIKVSDTEFAAMAKKGSTVSGKKKLIQEFQKHAVKREKTFTITYKGNINDIPSDTIIEEIGQIDDKRTSDDADFLSGSILDLGWSGYYNSSNQLVLSCKLNYTENASQVKKVSRQSKKILKKLKISGMSDVAKVKVIHDYVVKLVTYDNSMRDHSAYGGLIASKHSTVCQGYALIMYKLLTDGGVPVHYVTGNANGPHAWNIVKINGKWYGLDATWDDPSDATSYDYFLIGSQKMSKDHKLDNYYKGKYKISAKDLNWKKLIKNSGKKEDKKVKTEQNKKEKSNAKEAKLRAEAIKMLSSAIDEALKEDSDISNYEMQMYDLCKKIFGFIIENMSDKAFEKFFENDEMIEAYMEGTFKYIEVYIMKPMLEYMNSEEFVEDIYMRMYEDFGQENLEDLSDKEMENIMDSYAYEIFTELLYYQSEQYTDLIVSRMVKKLNKMAS